MKRQIQFGFLVCAVAASSGALAVEAPDLPIADKVALLKSGQYVWEDSSAPAGSPLLVINLTTQRALLFRGGVLVAGSTISTGSEGRETPLGTFPILEKQVFHRSRTYDDAPMPYMQRLTWKGVSMHAGDLPGYPASHGCIRLPKGFAKLLYGVTQVGTPVVITDAEQERLAAEYRQATEETARKKAELVQAAQRALADHAQAQAAHEKVLQLYQAELSRTQPTASPE